MYTAVIKDILVSSWEILLNSSIFMLTGFIIAGLLKAFLPVNFVAGHLGKGRYLSVIKASALGVPLPLCSCGVLPAAAGLKEEGANRGATASFLISTPETGVDSIAVSWALLDPIMTVFRPLSAFLTAIVTGFIINIADKGSENFKYPAAEASDPASTCPSCCGGHCHNETESLLELTALDKLQKGMTFAFGELFEDIARWFMAGVIIAGAIDVFLSPNLISDYLGEGILSMLIVLAVSAPLYICATASTPIAAALALKGLSPGAALVLLLAGPATNAAAVAVITKLLGKRATVVYIAVIALVSVLFGLLANFIYQASGLSTSSWISSGTHGEHGFLYIASAIILIFLFARVLAKDIIRKKKPSASRHCG